jgi:ribosomal protein S18 acetylase RimI-like enzyme
MHVLPAYQRRGLGQRLMEEAIRDADKDGAKAYLSASDAGRRLYLKYGFKDLEVKYVDFRHLGATGARNTTAMMREPQSVKA